MLFSPPPFSVEIQLQGTVSHRVQSHKAADSTCLKAAPLLSAGSLHAKVHALPVSHLQLIMREVLEKGVFILPALYNEHNPAFITIMHSSIIL